MNEHTRQQQAKHGWIKKLLSDGREVLRKRLISVFDVTNMIEQIRDQLETHLCEEEEKGGLLETIAEQAPRLIHRVDQRRQEHTKVRELLVLVHRLALTGDGADPWWENLEQAFVQLEDAVNQHEQAETRLMQDAYLVDIGSQD